MCRKLVGVRSTAHNCEQLNVCKAAKRGTGAFYPAVDPLQASSPTDMEKETC